MAFAKIISPETGASFEGSIKTLGLKGLGMFSKSYLEVDSLIEILVTFSDGNGGEREERIQGKVVGVSKEGTGNSFGIEFKEKINQEKNPALFQYLHQAQTQNS